MNNCSTFLSRVAGFPPPANFLIPHSLSLDHERGVLYVADRENGRVLTFDTKTGHYRHEYKGFGDKVFAISFSPSHGTLNDLYFWLKFILRPQEKPSRYFYTPPLAESRKQKAESISQT
jgi:hypothetical protein